MTTCVTATDVWSADGSVVLMERGTKLVGETRGGVAQGSERLFVLWSEARTPTGVVVTLASPGTDALGRSGVTGAVDSRHGNGGDLLAVFNAYPGPVDLVLPDPSFGDAWRMVLDTERPDGGAEPRIVRCKEALRLAPRSTVLLESLPLPAGATQVTVTLVRPGFRQGSRTLRLPDDARAALSLALEPAPAPALSRNFFLDM